LASGEKDANIAKPRVTEACNPKNEDSRYNYIGERCSSPGLRGYDTTAGKNKIFFLEAREIWRSKFLGKVIIVELALYIVFG